MLLFNKLVYFLPRNPSLILDVQKQLHYLDWQDNSDNAVGFAIERKEGLEGLKDRKRAPYVVHNKTKKEVKI